MMFGLLFSELWERNSTLNLFGVFTGPASLWLSIYGERFYVYDVFGATQIFTIDELKSIFCDDLYDFVGIN